MSPKLTFGEIADIEQSLIELGHKFVVGNVDATLRDAAQWFANLSPPLQERLGPETFAKLTSASRGHPSVSLRHLCMGALALIQRDASAHPERARFVARFAAQRLGSLGEPPPFCSSAEQADAHALFEAAKGDRSYSDTQLAQMVEPFVKEHSSKIGFYGQLAAGLNHLLGILTDGTAIETNRETARAALTYFVITTDAIPDDLGLVGLLDDAIIVQRAVAEIHPERRDIAGILDGIKTHWPFVEALALASAADQYPLSEFVLVNSALLLDEIVDEAVTGAVVIVPDAGPLPLLCGFLRALAELRRIPEEHEVSVFQPGNRLRNRANDAEVEFLGYLREDRTGGLLPCGFYDATHFQYRSGKGTSRTLRIEKITTFSLSARTSGTLKGGNKSFDQRTMAMGPLERLFGRTRPIVVPATRRRTVVVMDPPSARHLAAELSLFGAPLHDILPVSGARGDRDGISEETWTKEGLGGRPMLTVVRTAAEALDLVQSSDFPVAGVVARVRHGTTDALNISRIHACGTPVVAFVGASDRESHELLDGAGLAFWNWDERWFGALYWPVSAGNHEIASYEEWLRRLKGAAVRIEPLHMPELDEAWTNLKRLDVPGHSKDDDEEDDDLLAVFLHEAIGLLHAIRTRVTPVDSTFQSTLSRRRNRLAKAAQSGFQWWREAESETVRKVVTALEGAIERLCERNMKWEALCAWAAKHPDGTVICNRATQAALATAPLPRQLACSTAASAYRLAEAIVPAWINAERMDRLLNPPAANELDLLLYGPEREWYETARRRHERAVQRLDLLASKRSLFRAVRPRTRDASPVEASRASPTSCDPEELQAKALRSSLLHRFAGDLTDPVPARLFQFAGGFWALFTAESRVRTVTHLLGNTDAAGQELHVKAAWDLEPGDLVVLVRGSDRDALRVAVDDVVPPSTRETASAWQRALRRYAQTHSLDEIVKNLADAGCRRHTSTVSTWLKDDTMIRPRDGRPDIEAIARATADPDLVTRLDDCVKCADELYVRHMSVGRQLVAQILDKVKSWISLGVAPDDIVDIDHRVVVVTVETVHDTVLMAPRSRLGRLESD